MNLVKLPFLVINLIFLVLSLSLLGFGIFLLTDETLIDRVISLSNLTQILKISSNDKKPHEGTSASQSDLKNGTDSDSDFRHGFTDPISYLLISVGCSLFFLSFIGVCGAIKDSRWIVASFGVVLALVFLLEGTGVALYFFVFKPDIKSYLAQGIKDHYSPELTPSGPGVKFTVLMDYLMIENKCCGINGDVDFVHVYERHRLHNPTQTLTYYQEIPEACCILNVTNFNQVNEIYKSILQSTADQVGDEGISPNFIRNRKELLQFADDPNCVSGLKGSAALLGEEHGCFDKIVMDWGSLIVLFGGVLGLLQLSGVAFSIFVFRAAYYDFHG